MNQYAIYYLVIVFIVFMVIKKILDQIIDLHYPTYNPPPTGNWKYLVALRNIFSILAILFSAWILILFKGKSNFFVNTLLILIILNNILYNLVDNRFSNGLIYYFIKKTEQNEKIIVFIDKYFNTITDWVITIFIIYSFGFIFFRK